MVLHHTHVICTRRHAFIICRQVLPVNDLHAFVHIHACMCVCARMCYACRRILLSLPVCLHIKAYVYHAYLRVLIADVCVMRVARILHTDACIQFETRKDDLFGAHCTNMSEETVVLTKKPNLLRKQMQESISGKNYYSTMLYSTLHMYLSQINHINKNITKYLRYLLHCK